MPRAKQRTPELRDRLLEVAIATLSEEGIARFTTRRVAERAGTSVPAVYELFDDKAGLVRAMFFKGFERDVACFLSFFERGVKNCLFDARVHIEFGLQLGE